MRERGLQIALMCLGVAVTAYAGCGGDGTTATTSTSGDMTTTGSDTTSGGMTTVTSGGMTTSGSASASSGGSGDNLGIECTADGDCGPGLKCLASDGKITAFATGGPANGYCSKDCASDDDCPGNTSLCFGAGGGQKGVCLLTCDLGPDLMFLDDPLDPMKCHGREDVRCASVTNTVTACMPTCGKDDQCPAGRFCDPRVAVCVDKANTGLASGAKCDPMAMTPECAGVCVNFTGGTTSCSSPCVLGGSITDPTTVTDCGGLEKGLCVYSPTGNGPGDFGFCAPGCSLQSDCQNTDFWCFGVGGLTGSAVDNGFCFGATPCPNGKTDCKSMNAKVMCTDTKYGPFCVDTTFPLGDAAPPGTSSSSGSSGSGSSGSGSSGSGAGGSSSSASVGSSGSGAGGSSSSAVTGVGAVTSSVASSSSTGP
ncbi:MAG: hypothetical protein ABJE95_17825 [Byssovorax sp.]